MARQQPRWVALLYAALLGATLIVLAYQVPARHLVDVGSYDGAYVQGFHEAERADRPGGSAAYLAASDGAARWTQGQSFLLFPQVGLPAQLRLRLRAADGPPVAVVVRTNGLEAAELEATAQWQEYVVLIKGGLLKPADVLIAIESPTTTLPDGRTVGVLLDAAMIETTGWPVLPYPAPVALGLLAGVLLWWLLGAAASPRLFIALGLLAGAFLLLTRLQPWPYPLRSLLPLTNGVLLTLAASRLATGPRAWARPALLDALALLLVGCWCAALLVAAQGHVTLSVPGVEKDFRVYATRDSLPEIFKPDGFYNLGYPLLLYALAPLAPNAFLAARLASALAAALLLAAAYLLARSLLGRPLALLALALLALSPLVVQYGLYIGSDMPFAALVTLCLAALASLHPPSDSRWPIADGRYLDSGLRSPVSGLGYRVLLAGLAGGLAFLVRHPGLLLLPFGLAWIWLTLRHQQHRRLLALFVAGFLLAALPQLVVNTLGTGNPLWSQQAKNIWLGVYGNTDWRNWNDAPFSVPDSIPLADVVLSDPARFLHNWWGNISAFLGTGAEDRSEFGRAVSLHLLGFPANLLAVAGLLGMLWLGTRRERLLLAWIALYVAAISVAFVLPRFVLPLTPIYALAAAFAAGHLLRRTPSSTARALALLLLLAVLWSGSGSGSVLANQPADEVAAIALVERTLAPGEQLRATLLPESPLAKYSAIAHRITDDPAAPLLLTTRPVPGMELLGQAGSFLLYRAAP